MLKKLWNKFLNLFRKEKYIYFEAYPKPKLTSTELSPEVEQRVNQVQQRINEAGIKHIHFSWNYDELAKGDKSLDDVANSICQFLEDLLDSKCEEVNEKV